MTTPVFKPSTTGGQRVAVAIDLCLRGANCSDTEAALRALRRDGYALDRLGHALEQMS